MISKSILIKRTVLDLVVSIIFLVVLVTPVLAQDQWVKACNGNIPKGAVIAGREANWTKLYIARASHKGGLHPGKVRPEFRAAYIPWGGIEESIECYEVFVGNGRWVQVKDGNVPSGAIKAGYESDGIPPLYIARAYYRGGLHPGKIRKEFGGAYIPWGGKEVKVNPYEVLVEADSPPPPPPKQTNAEIINGNLNMRDTYPRFSWETLFKFRLTQGQLLGIVEKGTRAQVLRRKVIADKYEWFKILYLKDNEEKKGWIYGGEIGDRKYIRLDEENTQQFSERLNNYSVASLRKIFIPEFFIAYVHAENTAVKAPVIKTGAFKTLLLSLCYAIIFIASLLVVRRWIFPNSRIFTFLTSLALLLILGFLSSTQFGDLIGRILSSKG